jgi:hypothetical protein
MAEKIAGRRGFSTANRRLVAGSASFPHYRKREGRGDFNGLST